MSTLLYLNGPLLDEGLKKKLCLSNMGVPARIPHRTIKCLTVESSM